MATVSWASVLAHDPVGATQLNARDSTRDKLSHVAY